VDVKKIKNIIVDFGGVVINLDGDLTKMPKIIANEFGLTEGVANDFWYKNRQKLITGKETLHDFIKNNSDLSEGAINKSAKRIRKSYLPTSSQINWNLLKFLGKLRPEYKIYGFSNTIDIKPDRVLIKIEGYFDAVFKSYIEGYVKPERAAFVNLLKKIKVKPEECLLIDDVDKNIAVAEKLGLSAIKFSSLFDLKKIITHK